MWYMQLIAIRTSVLNSHISHSPKMMNMQHYKMMHSYQRVDSASICSESESR